MSWLRVAAVVAVLSTGCASLRYPVNPALVAVDPGSGYRLDLDRHPEGNRTFVILALSGGGTRAAALAYGVLGRLREAKLSGGSSLLDEVDVISSVSGGSFAAAYYGWFGQAGFFEGFERDVLRRRIQRDLILRILSPWNWLRLLSPWFGRGDLADEYYDRHIFAGASFGEMPRERPFIVLNTTDVSMGTQLSFVQDHFDALCSNLDDVKLSRGVTASSAFPVAFSPLTLRNYHDCNYVEPDWVELALTDIEVNPGSYDRARVVRSYADEKRRFIHVMDGGIADNIGLRGSLLAITTVDPTWSLLRRMQAVGDIDRIVVIVVDAKPMAEPRQDRSARPPWIGSVLNTSASKPMENFSGDTVALLMKQFDEWRRVEDDYAFFVAQCRSLAGKTCGGAGGDCVERRTAQCREEINATDADAPAYPALYRSHVRFQAIPDEEIRRRLEGVATALQLPEADVDCVTAAGAYLLSASPGYQALLAELGADAPAPDLESLRTRCAPR